MFRLELIIQGFGIVVVNEQETLTWLQRFEGFENALMTMHRRECTHVNGHLGCIRSGLKIAHRNSPISIGLCFDAGFPFVHQAAQRKLQHLQETILLRERNPFFALEQTEILLSTVMDAFEKNDLMARSLHA
jgi:hypothetical protein